MGKVFPVDHKLPVREGIHPADDIYHGGFAASRFSQNNKKLILIDIQIDALQNVHNIVTSREILGNTAQRDQNFLFLALLEGQPFIFDHDSSKCCHARAEQHFICAEKTAVFLVDDFNAADDILQIVQRHADHTFCNKSALIKHGSLKARIDRDVLNQYGVAGTCDNALNADAVFDADIGNIRWANVIQGDETVTLRIAIPDHTRLAIKCADKNLQTPRNRICELVNFQQLLHNGNTCSCKLFFICHTESLPCIIWAVFLSILLYFFIIVFPKSRLKDL